MLFDAFVLELARAGMVVTKIGALVGESDQRLWPIIKHYVSIGWLCGDWSGVTRIGVDETAWIGGEKFVTLVADAAKPPRILEVVTGRDSTTLEAVAAEFPFHGGDPAKVTEASLDMSGAYKKGLREHFPNAKHTFDRFHVVKLANGAVDKIRREEVKQRKELIDTRYVWLKNRENHTRAEAKIFQALKDSTLKTARAFRIRESLQELWTLPDRPAAEAHLKHWFFWATHSRLRPIIRLARTVHKHAAGILRWYDSGHHNNALLEGLASLVQAAKARARGFRTFDNARVVIYLLLGGIDAHLPSIWRNTPS